MPAALSYPGVYIEEIPSGVRTITGVPTSIAAFVGRARRGPTNTPIIVNSFGDFERAFGGLWLSSQLGYAVRDFFLNGGGQAIIVRLFRGSDDPSTAAITAGALPLQAANEGAWGTALRVTVDTDTPPEVATALGIPSTAVLFNLSVEDASTGRSERFLNLTVVESARRVDRVLAAESSLIRYRGTLNPASPPTITAGSDAVTAALDTLDEARAALTAVEISDPGGDHSTQQTAVTTAETAVATAQTAAAALATDGAHLTAGEFLPVNGELNKQGLYALQDADIFNILCIPPYSTADTVSFDVDLPVVAAATAYCERRRAMYIIDPPSDWNDTAGAISGFTGSSNDFPGVRSRNASLFFPRVKQPNPLRQNRLEEFAPSGAIAGVFARTDTQRGVWKAPAGLEATLVGVPQLEVNLTDGENGQLNQLGINCLRAFQPAGRVVWGARTTRGADQLADEWKYIPVRRTALFIEESLFRGTKWAVFEPNDEPLWSQLRLNIGAFMHNLFRQGAFQGQTPRDAYFVKCDSETTTQTDINLGIVNIVVGFAPLKPAEFVVIKLQQIAGEIQA